MEALPAEPAENDLLMIIKMIKKKLRGLSKPSIWGSTAAPYCLKYIIEGSLKKLSTQEINFPCIIILVQTHFTTNIWNTFIFGTWDRNVQKKDFANMVTMQSKTEWRPRIMKICEQISCGTLNLDIVYILVDNMLSTKWPRKRGIQIINFKICACRCLKH